MQEYQKERLANLVVELVNDKIYKPMKAKEMAVLMGIPKEERRDFQEVLDNLLVEGKISISLRGKYGREDHFSQSGIFHSTQRGFGFVSIEGRVRDVFIPYEETMHAMDMDKVLIIIDNEASFDRSAEGRVIRILEHAHERIVGIYRKNKGFAFVIPDDKKLVEDIFIPKGKDQNAVDGHKVVVQITNFGEQNRKAEGEVVEILGHTTDPGVDILSLVRSYELPEAFSEEMMEYVSHIPTEPTEAEIEARREHDFRDMTTVTIDGEDAKDLDDAISLSYDSEKNSYRLYVHIADVSHYVKENSLLDQEALNRATSVYLTDRVIPMLPRALSNGICSLNEGEPRLSLTCIMDIDARGEIISHEICEAVIEVDKRMSYNGVHAVLTGSPLENGESIEDYKSYQELLMQMYQLSQLLRKRRAQRGGIDFDFPESKISLDEKGKVTDIQPYIRNESHELIEDFMLAANETVAEDFFWQDLPFVYRVHEKPELEKMQSLSSTMASFGHVLRVRDEEQIRPKDLQKLLEEIAGSPEEMVLKTLTLRSMKKARYTTDNLGHFGLAARYYTHFTSPIRRYPDLQIHRIIKEDLKREMDDKRIQHYEKILPSVTERSSVLERRAEEVERECDKLKKCEYMRKHIGEEFRGRISGITNYGFYVELENTVEGLVSLNLLDSDYYYFKEDTLELIGEHTGRRFRLGEQVRVSVLSVNQMMRTIDFLFLGKDSKEAREEISI